MGGCVVALMSGKAGAHYALPPHQSSGSSENAQPRRPAPYFVLTHDKARDIELISAVFSQRSQHSRTKSWIKIDTCAGMMCVWFL